MKNFALQNQVSEPQGTAAIVGAVIVGEGVAAGCKQNVRERGSTRTGHAKLGVKAAPNTAARQPRKPGVKFTALSYDRATRSPRFASCSA